MTDEEWDQFFELVEIPGTWQERRAAVLEQADRHDWFREGS